jgi:hypothetical protein
MSLRDMEARSPKPEWRQAHSLTGRPMGPAPNAALALGRTRDFVPSRDREGAVRHPAITGAYKANRRIVIPILMLAA